MAEDEMSQIHPLPRPSNGSEPCEQKVGYRVLLPPARYIPLSVTDIVDSIKSHIPHAQRAGEMLIFQDAHPSLTFHVQIELAWSRKHHL
jgi:hypothetical protein